MREEIVQHWLKTGDSYQKMKEKFGVSLGFCKLAIDEFLENEKKKKSV
jgi:hypothetical protein